MAKRVKKKPMGAGAEEKSEKRKEKETQRVFRIWI